MPFKSVRVLANPSCQQVGGGGGIHDLSCDVTKLERERLGFNYAPQFGVGVSLCCSPPPRHRWAPNLNECNDGLIRRERTRLLGEILGTNPPPPPLTRYKTSYLRRKAGAIGHFRRSRRGKLRWSFIKTAVVYNRARDSQKSSIFR